MKCDDCIDCVDFETDSCVPKLWDVGYANGCGNRRVMPNYKPLKTYRTEEQKKEDKKTAEFYNVPGYKGD